MEQRNRGIALGLALAAIAACGGASGGDGYVTSPGNTTPGGTSQGSNTNVVSLGDLTFSPTTINVPAGTKVTWQWKACTPGGGGYGGDGCIAHNVAFDDGSNIASPVQDTGSYARTFPTAGTYKYHCAVHGAAMSGTVVVR